MDRPSASGPRESYRVRAQELAGREEALSERLRRLGTLRIVTFLAAVAVWAVGDWTNQLALQILTALPVAAFIVQVRGYRRTRRELRRTRVAGTLAKQGIARLDRSWDELPEPGPPPREAEGHRYAGDLDLFGRASLWSLLGPVQTPMGRQHLQRWLLDPSPAAEVPGRQEAVRELAAAPERREAVAIDGALVEAVAPEKLGHFLAWCTDSDRTEPRMRVLAWVLPALTGLLALGDLLDLVPTAGWVSGLIVQAFLAHRWGPLLHARFARASSGVPGIRQYADLFARWEHWDAHSPLLRKEVAHLNRDDRAASDALASLGRILHLADIRLSLAHPFLAVGVLWDVHVARALDRWRDRWGRDVPGWMEALGHLEALSALATLSADHPDWAFPEPGSVPAHPGGGGGAKPAGPGDVRFSALGLGHPLIPPDRCVRNDVALGPPGTVLLVTGSNMSGKSTLLRSIGLAVVLARAGGPVCARELHLPEVRLFTSMRVSDSVEDGVSFFMAELLRLKSLLDAAPSLDAPASEPPLLYLVDEILQGTNSEERQMAGRRLIRHLLRRRAIGAVTTHDLDLHRDPRLEPHAELVHLREAMDAAGSGLTFDYRLRPGLATTRNALLLAETIGLTEPED